MLLLLNRSRLVRERWCQLRWSWAWRQRVRKESLHCVCNRLGCNWYFQRLIWNGMLFYLVCYLECLYFGWNGLVSLVYLNWFWWCIGLECNSIINSIGIDWMHPNRCFPSLLIYIDGLLKELKGNSFSILGFSCNIEGWKALGWFRMISSCSSTWNAWFCLSLGCTLSLLLVFQSQRFLYFLLLFLLNCPMLSLFSNKSNLSSNILYLYIFLNHYFFFAGPILFKSSNCFVFFSLYLVNIPLIKFVLNIIFLILFIFDLNLNSLSNFLIFF